MRASDKAVPYIGFLASATLDATTHLSWLTYSVGLATLVYTLIKIWIVLRRERRDRMLFDERMRRPRRQRDSAGHWGD